jgi:hypothetical protein
MTGRFAVAAVAGRRAIAVSSINRRLQSSLSSLPSWQRSATDEDNEQSFWKQQQAHEALSRPWSLTAGDGRSSSYSHHHSGEQHPSTTLLYRHATAVPSLQHKNKNALELNKISLEQFVHEIPHWLWYRQRCHIPAGSPLDPVLQQCRYVPSSKSSL